MEGDGARGDLEQGGDLLGALPEPQEVGHLNLARGELGLPS
jgi:hypothetical protein